ncbi:hypothetical protein TNCV_154881 [Trichonephila clavipes]|uniref:Uncharacterized protein n=1 Tax=Trichonephila clavipes TaxID=2585209 RepID=A0A8X6WHK8_TRICX|nr:hypothetical protein TNCV_154881 [Trichonephila clavipes]
MLVDLSDISNMQYQAELTELQNDNSVKTLFSIKEKQETKLPVRLINTTNERRLVQGYETTPLRVKEDIEDVSSELDNGD